MYIVLICFLLVVSASANFTAELDLLEPAISCRISGEGYFKSLAITANDDNQIWKTGFRFKEDTDLLNLDTNLWQRKNKQGFDLSFAWKSGHATLRGKYSLSEGKSTWTPKLIADFNPYIDATLQYEYLANGGKCQLNWQKKLNELGLVLVFTQYKKANLQLGVSYNTGVANMSLTFHLQEEGLSRGSFRLGLKQDAYKGSLQVDVAKNSGSTVTMKFGVDSLNITGKVKDNENQLGLATSLGINEFTWLPTLIISNKGIRFGLKIKIA